MPKSIIITSVNVWFVISNKLYKSNGFVLGGIQLLGIRNFTLSPIIVFSR